MVAVLSTSFYVFVLPYITLLLLLNLSCISFYLKFYLMNVHRVLDQRGTHDSTVMGNHVIVGQHSVTGFGPNSKSVKIEFINIRGLNTNLNSVHLHIQHC